MNPQAVDTQTLQSLVDLVGMSSDHDLLPIPMLFCTVQKDDEGHILNDDGGTKMTVLGLSFFKDELVEYPFVLNSVIGGEQFISTTKDVVYVFPLALLTEVSAWNLYVLEANTGLLKAWFEDISTIALGNHYTLAKDVLISIPSEFSTNSLHACRYVISGGKIYEQIIINEELVLRKTLPYDVRIANEQSFIPARNHQREEVVTG